MTYAVLGLFILGFFVIFDARLHLIRRPDAHPVSLAGEKRFAKRFRAALPAIFLVSFLLWTISGAAQSFTPSANWSETFPSLGHDAPGVAALPLYWVNQHECDGTATVVKQVCHQGDSQCPTGPGDYDTTLAGLQQALTDAETLRMSSNLGTLIQITVGAQFHITLERETIKLRNLGYTGTACIVVDSSNPLPSGVRVGSIAISSIARQENSVIVVTQSPHGLSTGQVAEIKNVTGWSVNFNGTYPVTVLDPLTFSYSQTGPDEPGTVTAFLTVVTGPETLAQQVASNMYTMDSSMIVANVIATDPGAHHYAIYDGEIAAVEPTKGLSQPLILLGTNPPASAYTDNPSHLGVDRLYVHGCAGTVTATIPIWPEPVPCGTQDFGVKMGVRMNCSYCWVMNSFLDQIQLPGLEAHVVGVFNGQGPLKIVNNHLRGGATSLHFGNTPPSIPGLIPSDIEVRLNTIDLDPNWYPLSHHCNGGPTKWGLKERLDFESAQRMVFEGNELFQSWCDGDQGSLVFMGPTACALSNCNGGNQNLLNDLYFANNLLAHGYGGFGLLGRGGVHGLSMPFQRFDVINNLIWDLGVPGHGNGLVREISVGSESESFACDAARSGNVSTLTACVCTITNCPYTGVSTGDWLLVTNCTDASFNISRAPALLSDPTTPGPITYSNPGADTSGVSCSLSNGQGWPLAFNFHHNTFIANPSTAGVAFLGNETGPVGLYARDFTLLDSISSNSPGTSTKIGWACSGLADGSRSTLSGKCYDTTSLNFHNFIAEGRSTSANYSEYFNGTETFPATTLYFPSTNSCYGNYTADCLGYVGDFATPNPADYHDFALCQGPGIPSANCTGRSAYAGAASDGQDYGVDLNQLDLARVKLQFNSNSFSQ
mgnify:CR=1 FL=1